MSTVYAKPLHDDLTALHARRRRAVSWTRALVALRWVLTALLALVIVDALVTLPESVRWAALGMMLMSAAATALWCRVREGDGTRVAITEARRLERAARLANHPLTTAVQLGRVGDGDTFTLALIARAEDRARRTLAGAARLPWAERATLRRQGGYLWAVVVVWLAAAVIQPGAIGQGVARLAWPAGGTEAFTLTRLTVRVSPGEPTRGENVRVRVATAGVRPATAELVELDESGGVVDRWPMASMGGGAFAYVLRSLREPVTFRVEAGGARSGPVRIEPREPALSDTANAADAADAIEPAGDAPHEAMEEHDGLTDLAQHAGTLEELADELLAAMADGDVIDADAAALEAGVQDFAASAQALGESLPTGAPHAESLRAVLEALRLPEAVDVDVDPASAAWLEGVRDAAADDRRELAPWAGEALAGEQVRGMDDDEPDASPAPATGGTYHHWVQAVELDGVEPTALMLPVPRAYRDLVRAYFTRVAADERRWRDDTAQER